MLCRLNSGSSSRNRIPWFASAISPGRRFGPPPMRACRLALWCGERYGACPWYSRLQSENAFAISICSSRVGFGCRFAAICESMVLPMPGGPVRSM